MVQILKIKLHWTSLLSLQKLSASDLVEANLSRSYNVEISPLRTLTWSIIGDKNYELLKRQFRDVTPSHSSENKSN